MLNLIMIMNVLMYSSVMSMSDDSRLNVYVMMKHFRLMKGGIDCNERFLYPTDKHHNCRILFIIDFVMISL